MDIYGVRVLPAARPIGETSDRPRGASIAGSGRR
jgi:hypothetical protein